MIDTKAYRSTMGMCFGWRGLMNALVVLSVRRTDPMRTTYVTHEWEDQMFNVDRMAAAMRDARSRFRVTAVMGYHGGRDDEKIFRTMSVRLGMHVEPAPHDVIPQIQLLIDDFRTGRLKARVDSLVARDAKGAIWQEETPGQTGILAALRCAHWVAQQYRPLKSAAVLSPEGKTYANQRERRRRLENPF